MCIRDRLRGAAEEKSRYTAEFERQLSEERKRGEERLQQYRKGREERDDIRVERRQIEKLAKRLTTYLEENTDKKHIPEALKKPDVYKRQGRSSVPVIRSPPSPVSSQRSCAASTPSIRCIDRMYARSAFVAAPDESFVLDEKSSDLSLIHIFRALLKELRFIRCHPDFKPFGSLVAGRASCFRGHAITSLLPVHK